MRVSRYVWSRGKYELRWEVDLIPDQAHALAEDLSGGDGTYRAEVMSWMKARRRYAAMMTVPAVSGGGIDVWADPDVTVEHPYVLDESGGGGQKR